MNMELTFSSCWTAVKVVPMDSPSPQLSKRTTLELIKGIFGELTTCTTATLVRTTLFYGKRLLACHQDDKLKGE